MEEYPRAVVHDRFDVRHGVVDEEYERQGGKGQRWYPENITRHEDRVECGR